jgi:hypothetical protein
MATVWLAHLHGGSVLGLTPRTFPRLHGPIFRPREAFIETAPVGLFALSVALT